MKPSHNKIFTNVKCIILFHEYIGHDREMDESGTGKVCDKKYEGFYETKNINSLDECYYNYTKLEQKDTNVNIINSRNPVNKKEHCVLLNSRKDRFYTHQYDPSTIVSKFNSYTG